MPAVNMGDSVFFGQSVVQTSQNMVHFAGTGIGKIIRAGVPENKRTYSSVYNNDKIGTGHARSTINSAQGWSAKTNKAGEWIQLDLGKEQTVAGTVIQPRGKNYQYVTAYTVSTSLDGEKWTSVPGVYEGHATELKEVRFPDGAVLRARYVRLIVKSWKGHVSLRADVLVVAGTCLLYTSPSPRD